METHREEKPFKCPNSKYKASFKSKSALNHHQNKKHLNPEIKCKYEGCTRHGFKDQGALDRHIKKSHDTNQGGSFRCPFSCEKVYTRKGNLQQHIDICHPDKRLACTYPDCSRRYGFSDQESLNRHLEYAHACLKLAHRTMESHTVLSTQPPQEVCSRGKYQQVRDKRFSIAELCN